MFWLRPVGLVLSLMSCLGAASATSGLYDESVSVTARDDRSRADDLRRAMSHVLERIVAPEDISAKATAALVARAADFVDQYEYRSDELGPGQPARTLLAVRFDRERIVDALARAGLGVWGETRPELVVWLLVKDETTPRFIGAEEGGALTAALQTAAARRRVPVILPLLDLTDQSNLNASDLDTANLARIRAALWRYETEVALIGTLVPAGDFQWESSWRFVGPGQTSEWKLGAMGSEEALGGAVDGAFSRLVRLYAPAGRAASVVEIQVEGIASMVEGENCGRYLRSLPTVTSVEWAGADATAVSWRLKVAGDGDSLRQILAESRRLRPAGGTERSRTSRVYQWVP